MSGVARDAAASNVTINNILPGPFETDRLRSAGTAQAKMRGISYDELQEQRKQGIPAKRIGVDEDMAGAAIFLASRAGDYVVGETIAVDGGVVYGSMGGSIDA